MTTTEQPPTEEPEEQEPDAATVARYNLNVGAANVDYGPFAAHGKYFPVTTKPPQQSETSSKPTIQN